MVEKENGLMESLRERVRHLGKVEKGKVGFGQYFDRRIDRVILDHMLRQGYFDSARIYAEKKGITSFSDLPVFQQVQEIKRQLEEDQSCKEALEWCSQNRTRLSKMRSQLELKLRMQEFINFLHKENDSVAAIKYARQNLAKFVKSEQLQA